MAGSGRALLSSWDNLGKTIHKDNYPHGRATLSIHVFSNHVIRRPLIEKPHLPWPELLCDYRLEKRDLYVDGRPCSEGLYSVSAVTLFSGPLEA
jgi:hypothetical protein